MNIILIVSDTFRQDHLGCYGNSWIRTPHLDQLAKQSTVFDRFFAASFPTMPARADLLTGKYTFTYLGWVPLPLEEATLPQLLTDAGYSTMGIVDTPFYTRNGYGYDRGFEDFLFLRGQVTGPGRKDVAFERRHEKDYFAPMTLGAAEEWLELHRKEKFFLLVDTWDPHEPWDPPDHYVEMYLKDYDGKPSPYPCYWNWKEAGLNESDIWKAHGHYCGEVTMVDRSIGRLVDRIESLGLMDNTAIIFTSDHGFYFGEHELFGKGRERSEKGFKYGAHPKGSGGKGRFLYRLPDTGEIISDIGKWYYSPLYKEVSNIPLIIYLPRQAPSRINALASIPDIMPTILDLANVEKPKTIQASSLLPLINGEVNRVHDLIITSWPLYNPGQIIRVVDDWERKILEPLPSTITDGEWTLIYGMKGYPFELYNSLMDPGQQRNIYQDNINTAHRIHKAFLDLLIKMGTSDVFIGMRDCL